MSYTDNALQLKDAIRALWSKLGIDVSDPKILHVEPGRVLVSAKKYDQVLAELDAEYPAIADRSNRVEWSILFIQHAPKRVPGQAKDVIILQGGVIYAGTATDLDAGDHE